MLNRRRLLNESPSMGFNVWPRPMAVRVQWYRENAKDCARRAEKARDPSAKAAYREMVRAWSMLTEIAEQLASGDQSVGVRPAAA